MTTPLDFTKENHSLQDLVTLYRYIILTKYLRSRVGELHSMDILVNLERESMPKLRNLLRLTLEKR